MVIDYNGTVSALRQNLVDSGLSTKISLNMSNTKTPHQSSSPTDVPDNNAAFNYLSTLCQENLDNELLCTTLKKRLAPSGYVLLQKGDQFYATGYVTFRNAESDFVVLKDCVHLPTNSRPALGVVTALQFQGIVNIAILMAVPTQQTLLEYCNSVKEHPSRFSFLKRSLEEISNQRILATLDHELVHLDDWRKGMPWSLSSILRELSLFGSPATLKSDQTYYLNNIRDYDGSSPDEELASSLISELRAYGKTPSSKLFTSARMTLDNLAALFEKSSSPTTDEVEIALRPWAVTFWQYCEQIKVQIHPTYQEEAIASIHIASKWIVEKKDSFLDF